LGFWNVRLADSFVEDYKAMNKQLDNISVVCSVLNNQLFHFIESNMENMNDVIQHKNRFDELHKEIHQVTQKRMQCGFKATFSFGQ
jgi:hypothetical protein